MKVDRSRKPKDHPIALKVRSKGRAVGYDRGVLESDELRRLCLDAGADDVGFVHIDNGYLAEDRDYILEALPGTQTLIAICVRINRDNIRSPSRSLATVEWHTAGPEVEDVTRDVAMALQDRGVRAATPAMSFPMEMQRWPEHPWVVPYKRVAVAAGLGHMGIHRNVIHPKFGSFMLLGAVLVQAPVSDYSEPLEYNPCTGCNLCVAACPVGAIKPDDHFDFAACYTHNYREFMSGFADWIENVADSGSRDEYRERVTDAETISMWQSLGYGPGYKSAYCVAVCPAGEDVIGPFLDDRKEHVQEIVRPLQEREEYVYVAPDSRAEEHVKRRFPKKVPRHVSNRLRPPQPRPGAGPQPTAAPRRDDNRRDDPGGSQGNGRAES